MNNLPNGWTRCAVSDLAETITKGTTPTTAGFEYTSDGVRFVKAESLARQRIVHERCAYIGEDAHAALVRSQLAPHDILFSIAGTLGRVGVVDDEDCPANINQALALVRLSDRSLVPFIARCLSGHVASTLVQTQGRGTGLQNLNLKQLGDAEVPLPPLAEQRRIVAKLDLVMARTSRARAELARIPALIARHKRAILAAAFGDWVGAAEQTPFADLVATVQNGLSKRRSDDRRHMNVLRLADLDDGKFSGLAPRSIALTEGEAEKYRLRDGDVVFIRVNGSESLVGRAFVWADQVDWAFCDHFIRFRVRDDIVSPRFVSWFFAADEVRAQIETSFVSSAGQKTVNQGTLGRILVPVPTIEVQADIVRRIESAFAWLDKVAHEHAQAMRLLGHLDQALLAKAFRGELVPQDPADEPAAELLARIRAERENSTPIARKRKTRA